MHGRRSWLVATCLFAATQAAAEYREVVVTDGGAISGRVRVAGELPSLPPQPVYKNQDVCGTSVTDQRLMVGSKGELRNAIVYLANAKAGKAVPRDRPVTLDNVKCTFEPRVLTATVGQMIEIHNSDPFLHDAHALLGPQTLFNVAIPKGRTVRKPLAYAGLVDINCNVRHTWMHAYLFIAEHPYHAVSSQTGEFVIDQVPPGTYRLEAWHELVGSLTREVTVEPGKTTKVDLELRAVAPETP